MQYPDYENGLVNLSNSILRNFGVPCKHTTLACLDKVLDKGFQNVVLMIFDGMGMSSLKEHLPEDSFLRSHLRAEISSVFPPTTTAALTSLKSGLMPAEHGWLGWSLYIKELQKNVELFTNTIKDSGGVQAAAYNVAETLMPYTKINTDINRAGIGKMHIISPYDGYRISTFKELFQTTRRLCGKPGRKYLYTYWNQPDKCMHETGCTSEQARNEIVQINQSVQELCERLTNTLVIVAADHGHIDIHYRFISDYPVILDSLLCPPAIESRATAFYVKEECKAAFPVEFAKVFGEDFILLTRDEVISGELFGNGTPHPRFAESIGDFLAVSVSDAAIAYNQDSKQFISTHAGLTKQEMDVPLILIET